MKKASLLFVRLALDYKLVFCLLFVRLALEKSKLIISRQISSPNRCQKKKKNPQIRSSLMNNPTHGKLATQTKKPPKNQEYFLVFS